MTLSKGTTLTKKTARQLHRVHVSQKESNEQLVADRKIDYQTASQLAKIKTVGIGEENQGILQYNSLQGKAERGYWASFPYTPYPVSAWHLRSPSTL
jgi:hypothetical protein